MACGCVQSQRGRTDCPECAVIAAALISTLLAISAPSEHTLGPSKPRALSAPAASYPPAAIESMYPLRPRLQLRARNLAKVGFKFPVARPVCVLGSDDYSKRWLQVNYTVLVRSGALCYVIEAQNEAAVNAIKALAPNLPIAGVADGAFVAAGLRGYPALIDRTGAVK